MWAITKVGFVGLDYSLLRGKGDSAHDLRRHKAFEDAGTEKRE